jgi:hypothetical protein
VPEVPAHSPIEPRQTAGSRRAFVLWAVHELGHRARLPAQPRLRPDHSAVDPLKTITGESYANDNPVNEADPTGLGFFGELEELGEEVGEGVAGFGDKLTFGLTKKVREAIGDENVDTCSAGYQAGGYAGLATTFFIPGEDDAEAAELGAEGVDEVGNTATSTTRATPGGDGAESVIIKERGPNGETLQVVHQVGKPLPDGGETIIIHQHAKYGPLPGSELVFPDVEP